MQFCRERGLGQETCYMSAVSVEEMAGNIIRYGFVNKRKHSINVYMIVDNGALTLRVRDDCMMFDPVQYMEQFNQTDKTNIIFSDCGAIGFPKQVLFPIAFTNINGSLEIIRIILRKRTNYLNSTGSGKYNKTSLQ